MANKMPRDLRPYENEAYGDGKPVEFSASPAKQETAEEVQEETQEVNEFNSQVNTPEKPSTESAQPEKTDVKVEKPTEDFQQKYNVLKGKYDAEVPKLSRKLSDQQRKTDQLEKMIGILEERIAMGKEQEEVKAEEKNVEVAQEPIQSSVVSQEDIDSFGEPLIRFIRKIVKGEIKQSIADELPTHIKQLSDEIGSLRGGLAKSDEERFYSDLHILAPMVDMLNEDEGFNDWLDQPNDELSGYTRRDFLNAALKELNVKKTAKFFTTYAELLQEKVQIPTEPTKPQIKSDAISEMVEPSKTRGGGAEVNRPVHQRQYSMNDLNELGNLVKERKISQGEFDRRYKEIVSNLKVR